MTESDFAEMFADLMPDTVIVTPGTLDAYGDFIASGQTLSLACRIEGQTRIIRDAAGNEVVSTVQVIIGSYNDLTADKHRYTLPTRYTPRAELQALSIDKESDETGPCYEVVYLP